LRLETLGFIEFIDVNLGDGVISGRYALTDSGQAALARLTKQALSPSPSMRNFG
jgi:DNA-binding PadR family transcriptional regulator